MNLIRISKPKGPIYCPYSGMQIHGENIESACGSIFLMDPDVGALSVHKNYASQVAAAFEKNRRSDV